MNDLSSLEMTAWYQTSRCSKLIVRIGARMSVV